jgi:hypothetical protein
MIQCGFWKTINAHWRRHRCPRPTIDTQQWFAALLPLNHLALRRRHESTLDSLAMNPAVNRKSRILKTARWTDHGQHLVRKPRREEHERVVGRLDFDKGVRFVSTGSGINPQNATRERFREAVKVIDSTDDPARNELLTLDGILTPYDGVSMFGEESTVAMRDHFHFKFARFEGLGAKPLKHRWQYRPHASAQFLLQIA